VDFIYISRILFIICLFVYLQKKPGILGKNQAKKARNPRKKPSEKKPGILGKK
jgi:hypothetical protein